MVAGLERRFVQLANQINRLAAPVRRNASRQVEVQDRLVARLEHRRLVHGRQEAVRIHRLTAFEGAVGVRHDDVGRQRFALGSQPVYDPRAHAREAGNDASAKKLVLGGGVHHHVAMAGADHRHLVDPFRHVRKQVGDFDPALTVFFERALRAEQLGGLFNELVFRLAEFRRARLAVEFVEQRLGVERFDVARPARHEQENDRLGFGVQMRRLGSQRVDGVGAKLLTGQHRRHRQRAESAECVRDEFAPVACPANVFRHIDSEPRPLAATVEGL